MGTAIPWDDINRLSNEPVPLVAVVEMVKSSMVRALVSHGVGVVGASSSSGVIADAVSLFLQGVAVLPVEVAADFAAAGADAQDPNHLSDLQKTLIRARCQGVTFARLADQLNYSERTLRRYMADAVDKMRVESSAELYHLFRQFGLDR